MSASSRVLADDTSLARIGATEIDTATLRNILPALDDAQRQAMAKDPSAQAQLVRSSLVQRLVVELAKRAKWDENPETQRQMAIACDNALAESYLKAICKVPDSYPSDQELRSFYDANRTAFMQPVSYRLAQLFIAVPTTDSSDEVAAQTKLDQAQAALSAADADFSEIARRFSDQKQSSSRGGEVGWVTESQLRPELRPLLGELKVGDVSRAVLLPDGWHIVKCLETRPASPIPFDNIRDSLAQRMRAERAASNRQAYLARLLQENPISINELALRDLFAKPTS